MAGSAGELPLADPDGVMARQIGLHLRIILAELLEGGAGTELLCRPGALALASSSVC